MNEKKSEHRSMATKITAIFLSVLFVFTMVSGTAMLAQSPFTTVAQAYSTFSVGDTVQTTDDLNLRKGAGANYNVITVIPKNTKLTVTAANTGEWVGVQTSSGVSGYVSATYLKTLSADDITLEKVTGLKAIQKTDTTLKLTFNAVENADGYKIYDAETGKALVSVTTQSGADPLVKTVTGLNPGETRQYKVRAYATVNGETIYGPYSDVYTKATAKSSEVSLEQVTGLKAIKKTATTLKLTFNAVEDASGYEIYDAETDKLLTTVSTQSGADPLVKTVTGLNPEETRQYKVRAYATVNGETVYGAFSDVYTKATGGLDQVTGLKAINKTETTLKLTFNAVEGAGGYQIYDAETDKLLTTVSTQSGADPLTKTVTGLNPGETRQYKVRAYATVNGKTVYGAFSDIYTKATAEAENPSLGQVTGLKAIKKTATTLKLNFNAVEGAEGYEIYDAEANKLLTTVSTQSAADPLVKTVTGLNPEETRQYKVRAYATVNGETVYGAFSDVYTKATGGLDQVTGLKAINKTETTLKLTFNAVEGAGGYQIYDAETNKLLTTVSTQSGADPLTKTVTGLNPGETRQYKVRAYATVNGKTVYGAFSDVYSKATAEEELVKYITTDDLNYRTAPSLSGDVVGTLLKGTSVDVVSSYSETADGIKWYKIKKDGNYYYVSSAYLKKDPSSEETEGLKQYTTTDAVNYRTSPSLSGTIVGTLVTGTVVDVVSDYSKTADGFTWFKIKMGSKYYYVASDYLKEGVTGKDVSVPQLMTLYVGYSSGTWKSSNENVATVKDGFVYGVSQGTATISCKTSTSTTYWTVTVTAAEPVKLAYATPNVVFKGDQVTFVAVTDTSRNSVKFVVDGKSKVVTNYTTETSAAQNGYAKTTSRVWKYTTTISEPGTYTAKIYSSKNADGSNMSSTYYTTDAFIVSATSETTSTVENRRISDKGIELIASWEGYYPTVYLDPLTSTIVPTVGYGYTLGVGDTFYNNLTKTEAWALLCEVINKGGYTTQVNKFIVNNNIKANQRNFDAMVSFSYNCGSGYWNGTADFDLRVYLLNAVNPNSVQAKITAGETVKGKTSFTTQVYSTKNQTGKGTTTIAAGTTVTITGASWDSSTKAAWYKVKTGSVTGYVPAPYVSITSHNFTKDMNYMDAITFGSELLYWHHAGGNCIAGLVYRRLGEAKVFSFGDYDAGMNNSSEKGKNTYNYLIPDCIKNKGWLT